MVLVSPELTPTERQRVAFEAAEQEASTREPTHVVDAHDDAREVPDCIRHASFEPEDVPLGGPAEMLPPEIPEDSDHRHPAIDGSSDPIADLPQDRVGRSLTRDGVKAIAPPEFVRSEPAALEAGQDAPVCRVVAKEHAELVALHPRREKARRRIELVLGLPEVADVVTRRRELAGNTQRNPALARPSTVQAPRSEEVEESVSLGALLFHLAAFAPLLILAPFKLWARDPSPYAARSSRADGIVPQAIPA